MTVRDRVDGFIGILGAYYVFNLKYPAELEGSLTFMQHYLLKINDGNGNAPIIPKVKKLINKLSTMY